MSIFTQENDSRCTCRQHQHTHFNSDSQCALWMFASTKMYMCTALTNKSEMASWSNRTITMQQAAATGMRTDEPLPHDDDKKLVNPLHSIHGKTEGAHHPLYLGAVSSAHCLEDRPPLHINCRINDYSQTWGSIQENPHAFKTSCTTLVVTTK